MRLSGERALVPMVNICLVSLADGMWIEVCRFSVQLVEMFVSSKYGRRFGSIFGIDGWHDLVWRDSLRRAM